MLKVHTVLCVLAQLDGFASDIQGSQASCQPRSTTSSRTVEGTSGCTWRVQGARGERRGHMEGAWLLQEAITPASEKILPNRCMVPDSKGPSPEKDLVPQMPAHR